MTQPPAPISQSPNLLNNPGCQGLWSNTLNGQAPNGYITGSWGKTEILPVTLKNQTVSLTQVNRIVALGTGNLQLVHKQAGQLPPDEQIGGSRQLIFPGGHQILKLGDDTDAGAVRLVQLLSLPPGALVQFSLWALIESDALPHSPTGMLEDDTALLTLECGDALPLTRTWGQMLAHQDLPRVNRNWNHLTLTGRASDLGTCLLGFTFQKNWPDQTYAFLYPESATILDPSSPVATPPPAPVPDPADPATNPQLPTPLQPGTQEAQLSALLQAYQSGLDLQVALLNLEGNFATHLNAAHLAASNYLNLLAALIVANGGTIPVPQSTDQPPTP